MFRPIRQSGYDAHLADFVWSQYKQVPCVALLALAPRVA
jgi:hypothetical protein